MKRRLTWMSLVVLTLTASGCERIKDGPKDKPDPCPCGGPLEVAVLPDLLPVEASLADRAGASRRIGASRDEAGVQTDFVLGEALLRPGSEAALQAFLSTYGGQVLGDDVVPEPDPGLGVTLLPEEREARVYLVRFDLGGVDLSRLQEDAATIGLEGRLELSDTDALLTLAGIANAIAEGYAASPNTVDYPMQAFPRTLLRSTEGGGVDALTTPAYSTDASGANVALAWQFVAAHGIERSVNLAVIDGGFWVDATGRPRTAPGDGTDLPDPPTQYDFDADTPLVGAPNPARCSGGNICNWHGNQSVGTAAGLLDNGAAAAGTGGLVATPMLFHADIRDRMQVLRAIRTATAWGADVINMSFGGTCNLACRQFDRGSGHYADRLREAHERGVVLVASAGNSRLDVVAGNFVHPCLISHVICVGAIDEFGAPKDYSNFGAGVDIWAPTDIPVMADGDDAGIHQATGTSASAPFLAGVAAMMKAIDTSLDGDEILVILRETAHLRADLADRSVDAWAAVLRAAEGRIGVLDRLEPNSPDQPVEAGELPWSEDDLNLHASFDVDSFRIFSEFRTGVVATLRYPAGLGALSMDLDLGSCGPAVTISDTAPTPNERRIVWQAPAGWSVVNVRGGGVNAYDLELTEPIPGSLRSDRFEPNDTPATATPVFRKFPMQNGPWLYDAIDSDTVIHANLDSRSNFYTSTDVDHFLIRGSSAVGGGGGLFDVRPAVTVFGNEGKITMEVFAVLPNGAMAPTPVGTAQLLACDAAGASVTLESGRSYFVRITGSVGRYSLANGVSFQFDKSRLPVAILPSPFEFVRPGPPIERFITFPLNHVFIGDRAFIEVNLTGPNLHLELYDLDGALLASGGPSPRGFDERLGLEGIANGQAYVLRAIPTAPSEDGHQMSLSWSRAAPLRTSANLIRNPGAELGAASDSGGGVTSIEGWDLLGAGGTVQLNGLPTAALYNGVIGLPDESSPGPEDRGQRFFAGGPYAGWLVNGMFQAVAFDGAWRQAIDAGAVRYDLSAFLGGMGAQENPVVIRATFVDSVLEPLAEVDLGPLSTAERGGRTGLFPVGTSGQVPPFAVGVFLEVSFGGSEGTYFHGYADNLEFVLRDQTEAP